MLDVLRDISRDMECQLLMIVFMISLLEDERDIPDYMEDLNICYRRFCLYLSIPITPFELDDTLFITQMMIEESSTEHLQHLYDIHAVPSGNTFLTNPSAFKRSVEFYETQKKYPTIESLWQALYNRYKDS